MATKQRLENKVYMKELIKRIADATDYYNYEVEDVLNGFRKVLLECLIQGKEVQLEQVFTISSKTVPPRNYIDSKTGEHKVSRGSVGLSIKPSVSLKAELLPILKKT